MYQRDLREAPRGRTAKILPHSIEAEEEALGMLLFDQNAIIRVAGQFKSELFYVNAHQTIAQAIIALHSQQQPNDLTSVSIWLSKRGLLEGIGGNRRLCQLIDCIVHAVNIDNRINTLIEFWKARRVIQVAREMESAALDPNKNWDDIIEHAQSQVFSLTAAAQERGLRHISEILHEEFNRMQAVEAGQAAVGVPTGFTELDKMTGGLKPENLVIVGGRPGDGKTALTVNVLRNVAAQGADAMLFSLEMSGGEIGRRILSAETRIESDRLSEVRIHPDEWETIAYAIANVSEAGIWIDESQCISTANIISRCHQKQSELDAISRANPDKPPRRIGLICIDYLHLMLDGSSDNEVKELGRITRECKQMARKLKCPVMLLSQLNREVEGQANKRPKAKDLRGSGAIEQDADLILMLYRDERHNPDTPDRGIAEVLVEKNRHGRTGPVRLLFEPQFTRFQNLQPARTYGS
ncbi:replicative DNA helicase [Pantanalinema sp. GBBB05]|uniref:replicative DNA helicase n=1 Tax=Pantanalinema sp. GBBB05 TaxID=2604139 RepID=UPI001DA76421|nr:replicative DNA helicase [Pantanalinema sp. GBBB05]